MDYIVVHILYPANTFPNQLLESILLKKIDPYIREGKCTMADSWGYREKLETDYRYSAWSNREQWHLGVDQNFFRIFFDKDAANDFIDLNYKCGAKLARVITEDDVGKTISPTVKFPSYEHVCKFVWKNN